MDIALLETLDSVPWSTFRRGADLGCGTGRTGEFLHARGIEHIDGVDLTPEMLSIARDKSLYETLLQADVRASTLDEAAYDLVVCCLVDEHLPDVVPLHLEAARSASGPGFFIHSSIAAERMSLSSSMMNPERPGSTTSAAS